MGLLSRGRRIGSGSARSLLMVLLGLASVGVACSGGFGPLDDRDAGIGGAGGSAQVSGTSGAAAGTPGAAGVGGASTAMAGAAAQRRVPGPLGLLPPEAQASGPLARR